MGNNHRRTIREFVGYLDELRKGCSVERRAFIREQARVCDDLRNYSDLVCRDFSLLDRLLSATFTATL